MGVEGRGLSPEQGAGDQGLMFGYASTSTENLMPMPIWYAHRLAELSGQGQKGRHVGVSPPRRQDPGAGCAMTTASPRVCNTVVSEASARPLTSSMKT